MTSAVIKTHIHGHVHIADKVTGEVLLDKDNAVHPMNMAIAIARGLSNEPVDATSGIGKNQIYKLKLGNGGSNVNSTDQITYLPPNITGSAADLYNSTYFEVVDEGQAGTPVENSVTFQQNTTNNTTIVITTMTIAAGEPSNQDTTDSPPDPNANSQYAFDELGLFTYDNLLLTHIIFSPILKTANRELVITYTLTISVS